MFSFTSLYQIEYLLLYRELNKVTFLVIFFAIYFVDITLLIYYQFYKREILNFLVFFLNFLTCTHIYLMQIISKIGLKFFYYCIIYS